MQRFTLNAFGALPTAITEKYSIKTGKIERYWSLMKWGCESNMSFVTITPSLLAPWHSWGRRA